MPAKDWRMCRRCAHCVPWPERVAAYARVGERIPLEMPDCVCLANWKVPVPVFGGSTPEERECERFERRMG